jgi:hypothetical protein
MRWLFPQKPLNRFEASRIKRSVCTMPKGTSTRRLIEQKIAALEEQIAPTLKLIEQYRAALTLMTEVESEVGGASPPILRRKKKRRRKTKKFRGDANSKDIKQKPIPNILERVFKMHPTTPMSAYTLRERVMHDIGVTLHTPSISAACSIMKKRGVIQRVDKGVYRYDHPDAT